MRCTCTSDRRLSLNAVDKRVSSLKQLELKVSTQEGIKHCCSLFLIFIFKIPPKPSKPIALTLDQRVEVVKKNNYVFAHVYGSLILLLQHTCNCF